MKSVLIVDDNELYLGIIEQIVKLAGYKVHCASNGKSALEILKKCRIPVMITDFNMPGMNGIQLAGMAKQLFPETLIVMATGDLSAEVCSLATQAGIAKVLKKPLDARIILKILEATHWG